MRVANLVVSFLFFSQCGVSNQMPDMVTGALIASPSRSTCTFRGSECSAGSKCVRMLVAEPTLVCVPSDNLCAALLCPERSMCFCFTSDPLQCGCARNAVP